jgi:hypothetical protein
MRKRREISSDDVAPLLNRLQIAEEEVSKAIRAHATAAGKLDSARAAIVRLFGEPSTLRRKKRSSKPSKKHRRKPSKKLGRPRKKNQKRVAAGIATWKKRKKAMTEKAT